MLKEIKRLGTFETNSSSTHSLAMCTKDEWEKFKKGEMLLYGGDEIITVEEAHKMFEEDDDSDTFEQFCEWNDIKTFEEWENNDYLESYYSEYEVKRDMKAGEKIIAFGDYGFDG